MGVVVALLAALMIGSSHELAATLQEAIATWGQHGPPAAQAKTPS